MRTLGLIPAKGGSTRLRRKNILPLGGKPLIGWAIDAALASGVIDRLVVSTEDEEIAGRARELGADVPFLRPDALARDPAGVVDVALHALDVLREQGEEYDRIVILLPTCPFRTAADIRDAMALFEAKNGTFLMSVAEFSHTPFAAQGIAEDGTVHPHFPDHFGKKAQEMPHAYRPNGAVHILRVADFERVRSYIAQPLLGFVMPAIRSVDIDHQEDLDYAEYLLGQGVLEQ